MGTNMGCCHRTLANFGQGCCIAPGALRMHTLQTEHCSMGMRAAPNSILHCSSCHYAPFAAQASPPSSTQALALTVWPLPCTRCAATPPPQHTLEAACGSDINKCFMIQNNFKHPVHCTLCRHEVDCHVPILACAHEVRQQQQTSNQPQTMRTDDAVADS